MTSFLLLTTLGGVAIDIRGKTKEIVISKNEIREMRKPMNRSGVRIGSEVGKVELLQNTIAGFHTAVKDERVV